MQLLNYINKKFEKIIHLLLFFKFFSSNFRALEIQTLMVLGAL